MQIFNCEIELVADETIPATLKQPLMHVLTFIFSNIRFLCCVNGHLYRQGKNSTTNTIDITAWEYKIRVSVQHYIIIANKMQSWYYKLHRILGQLFF